MSSGGYGRRRKSPSIKKLNDELMYETGDGNGSRLDSILDRIPAAPVTTCTRDCPMFKNSRCVALGIEAPLGLACKAQRISKER